MKKSIVFIMNCAADELLTYLNANPTFYQEYEATCHTTYLSMDDENAKKSIYESVSQADVLITQNVKSVDWLTNEELAKHIKSTCQFIRLAFWRFDGYWPVPQSKSALGLWYFPDEFGPQENFSSYTNHFVDENIITDKFHRELGKFATIDEESDIKMLGFFMDNYKKFNLFSDDWHPSSFFFHEVAKRILKILQINGDIWARANDYINKNRHRLVLNTVKKSLNLNYDMTYLRYYDNFISQEVYFHFSNYARNILKSGHPDEAGALFDTWRSEIGLSPQLKNIAPLGYARQSSLSQWSQHDDSNRALTKEATGSFAFHTDLDERPWWQLDLRDIREVSQIKVWNRDGDGAQLRDRALPLVVSISANGFDWKTLSTINYPFGGAHTGRNLVIDFATPQVTRYIKLEVAHQTYLHLDRIEVLSKVIDWLD